MDQHKLRTLVFEKTGVKVDIDDPIFALVALNEAVLAEAVERHIALLDAASRELTEQVRTAGGLAAAPHAGGHPPGYVPTPAAPVKAIPTRAALFSPRELRLLAAAAGVALLTALLVTGLHAAFSKPAALTPAQAAAIAEGEKLAKAVETLDPKARAQLRAELQK
ncbi:hypothetical protein [Pseudoduganella namucuonensis]|uniref:Uncharacterized protein n=1 Tax=Pseudoduganella namucuonensis TaxID=1035707 RepID=A0A1I7KL60_9BURK|nr:hypothetical protein [Pseudoduganella namucuonensis]SFU98146.1 hypothetical protein SAMN05216552_1017123 [Pseudoduganella namucuonensis]